MSLDTIQAAIDGQLATLTGFPLARIIFLNVTYSPEAGKPFLAASMPVLKRTGLTVGADQSIMGAGYVARWDGSYQVDCVWPEDAGSDGASQMTVKILRLFPRGLTISTTDGLQIMFDTATPIPVRPDGAWYRGAARCPWWCFEHD